MDESLSGAEEVRRDEPPVLEGQRAIAADYTLRFTGWPDLSRLVAIAVATATYTVLSYIAVSFIPAPVMGVSSIFFPIIFGFPFALWFGGWSLVIAFIGNFVGAGLLLGTPVIAALPGGVSDLIQLCIPVVLYRWLAPRFGLNPLGKDVFTVRGFLFFALVGVIPWNILGGLYGNYILLQAGFVAPDLFLLSWAIWAVGNIVLLLVAGSIILSTVGPLVERFGLTVRSLLR